MEEVAGKKRKEGNKEKKLRVRVWRRKKEGKKKNEKKEGNMVRKKYFHNTFTINLKW